MASIAIRKQTKGSFYYASVKRDGKWSWAPTGIEARGKKAEKAALLRAEQIQREIDEEAKRAANPPPAEPAPVELCGPLLEKWIASLTNRNARNDELRARAHLVPRFKDLPVDKLTKGEIVRWLRELRAAKALGGWSQCSLFGLLSRFCSWLSADDTIPANPCKSVDPKERPKKPAREQNRPWLDDEAKVQALAWVMGPQWGLAFLVGNRANMRPGEVMGLRVSDVDLLASEGVLHVSHSYDGRLKEDRGGEQPKDKTPPLRDATTAATLVWYAEQRRNAGAKDDDHLFDWAWTKHASKGGGIRTPNAIRVDYNREWNIARAKVPGVPKLSFYEATRHSGASRALKNGARFEEVSASLGHASITTTERHYNRHMERAFKTIPTTDIGAPVETAKVLPLRKVG